MGATGGTACFEIFRIVLSKVGVAPSSNTTYPPAWKVWVNRRQATVKTTVCLDASLGEDLVAQVISNKFGAYVLFKIGKSSRQLTEN